MTDEEIEARLKELAYLKIHPRDQEENKLVLLRMERLYEESLGQDRAVLPDRSPRRKPATRRTRTQKQSRPAAEAPPAAGLLSSVCPLRSFSVPPVLTYRSAGGSEGREYGVRHWPVPGKAGSAIRASGPAGSP